MRSGRRPRVRVPVINPNTKPMCSSTVLRPRNGNWRRRLSRAFKLGIAAYTSCRVNPSTACSRQGGLLGGIFKCRRQQPSYNLQFFKNIPPHSENRTHAGSVCFFVVILFMPKNYIETPFLLNFGLNVTGVTPRA